MKIVSACLAGINCKLTPNDPTSIETVREGKTDRNGLWIVRGLFPGQYTATATLPDGREVTDDINIIEHDLTQKQKIVE